MNAAERQHRLAIVLLWVVPAMWSSNYLIARFADGVIAPHALATGRWVVALALMLPFAWRALADPAVWKAEWKPSLALGALGMWICGAWVYRGGQETTAVNIALIYAATPIAIAVAGVLWLREPLSARQAIGTALACAGVLWVIAKGDPRTLAALAFNPGDAWIVGAAVAWAAYSVGLKAWPSRLAPLPRLAMVTTFGLLVLSPFTAWEAITHGPPAWTPRAVAIVLVAGLVPGVLAFAAYSVMQRELGVARTALVMYLAPIYGALGAWWLLGEAPGWHHLVGAALILPSIRLATSR